jgi:SAM-dependent methyltransferase
MNMDEACSNRTRPLNIDIGCGNWKEKGYIGIDIYDGDEVDLKVDLSRERLPFDDSTVAHAVTYHCLEHIHNLQHLIEEVWRVLEPNAQFFVCVPYFNSFINAANIFHVRNFNEHSFRFFSSEVDCDALPDRLWRFHFTPQWGLKGSANADVNAEFRTLHIEFDYFPSMRGLTDDQKETARISQLNVVHQICFYLQALKPAEAKVARIGHQELMVPGKRQWMLARSW